MSEIRTYEDSTVIEALDFDVPCACGEDHAAELFVSCRTCRRGGFYCRPHFERIRAEGIAKLHISRLMVLVCGHCDTPTRSFDALFVAVPL